MTRKVLALCLGISSVGILWPISVQAEKSQKTKKEELVKRVEQLEKQVAELAELIKRLKAPAQETTGSELERKLVGNWAVADADRKVEGICIGLRLKGDGTAKAVLNQADGRWNSIKYDLVGKQLQLSEDRQNSSYFLAARLKSVTETELVLEYTLGETPRQVVYTRE